MASKPEKVKVGIIGCGSIAPAYVRGCTFFSSILELAACADIDLARAQDFALEHDLKTYSVDDLLADPDIQIVINLTVPKVHAEVSLNIIAAGKHAYSEKPLGVTREEGQQILAAAEKAGVRVGCAPDTFLGGGIQTSRKVLDDGWIGEPVAAVAFFAEHGPEAWHQNPHFFYQFGGGPLFDLGPYYLTALVSLLGPVKRVMCSARISFPERIATSETWFGERIPVEVPTHVSGTLEFVSGAVATVITSFDIWADTLPRIELYGADGSLSVPDPNAFRGPVRVWQVKNQEFQRREGGGWHEGSWHQVGWQDVPLTHDPQVSRGIGVADLAYALRSGRPHRASGALAFHVLDIMQSFYESSERGQAIALTSQCDQPAPLPLGLLQGTLDE
ncbi:MAG: Gfo/Idh/MocA family oxidoreductase [Anaerolineae bacterium]|nr:Gfo/Idh/MocA family oxidoreductase [Anaerolineae bacterium]